MFPTVNFHNALPKSLLRPRIVILVLLFLYILIECIVIGGCVTSQTTTVYVSSLTYSATEMTYADFPQSVLELEVRVGYFSTCMKLHTNETSTDWLCGTNDDKILGTNSNFDSNSDANIDLYTIYKATAYRYRHQCLLPWLLFSAIFASFFTVVCFIAFPRNNHEFPSLKFFRFYILPTFLSFLSFILSLLAAVWQETNTATSTNLMNVMVDQYYSVKATYGSGSSALLWVGVILTGFGFLLLSVMTILSINVKFDEYRESNEYQISYLKTELGHDPFMSNQSLRDQETSLVVSGSIYSKKTELSD